MEKHYHIMEVHIVNQGKCFYECFDVFIVDKHYV